MAVALSSLVTPLVKSAVLADIYTLLGAVFGSPVEFDDGAPVPAILDTFVGWAVDDIWNPLVVPALQAPFLDYATGFWLSLIADLVYNRPRLAAQAGTQVVTFENRSTLGAVAAAAGTVRIKAVTGPATGATYTTQTALSIVAWSGSGSFPTGQATCAADVAGTASNTAAGTIAIYSTPLVMGPVNCFVQSVAGNFTGTNQETDANLVVRCRAAVSEVSDMGPRAEYTSIALDPVGAFTRRNLAPPSTWTTPVPAISRVAVYEPGGGVVNVYLASASGPAAGSMGAINSDVGMAYVALLAFVQPPGITVNVYAADQVGVDITSIVITLSSSSNVTQPEAVATANAGLTDLFATIPIGGTRISTGGPGYLFLAAVEQACWGPGVVDVTVTGFADIGLGASVVPVLDLLNPITANVISQGN